MPILDLPFVKSVQGVQHRATNPRWYDVIELVPCAVPEVDSRDLDIVLEVERGASVERYFALGDRLATTSTPYSSDLETEAKSLRGFVDAVRDGRSATATPLMQHLGARSIRSEILMADAVGGRLRTILTDQHDRDRNAFDAAVENLVILDGRLTRTLTDPVWLASRSSAGGGRLDLHFDAPPVNVAAFRFDRRSQAEEYVERCIGRPFGGPAVGVVEHCSRRWQFDEASHSLREMQSQLVSYWSKDEVLKRLHLQPAEFFIAFCGLRDATTVESALIQADRLLACIDEAGPKSCLRAFEQPLELWTWAQRALADRRDQPDPEELGAFHI